MKWLEQLKKNETPPTTPLQNQQNPEKTSFAGFVVSPSGVSENFSANKVDIVQAIENLKGEGLEIIRDDDRFIRDCIAHRMNWRALLDSYREKWLSGMEGHKPHQAQNKGRFAANTWLREVKL